MCNKWVSVCVCVCFAKYPPNIEVSTISLPPSSVWGQTPPLPTTHRQHHDDDADCTGYKNPHFYAALTLFRRKREPVMECEHACFFYANNIIMHIELLAIIMQNGWRQQHYYTIANSLGSVSCLHLHEYISILSIRTLIGTILLHDSWLWWWWWVMPPENGTFIPNITRTFLKVIPIDDFY